jgi:hypothetical protein
MNRSTLAPGRAQRQARAAIHQASPWLERWGRLGYVAHGLVYGLVGLLALQVAAGVRGSTPGSRGALEQIVAAPLGQFLLAATAVGLLGYASWRFVQAFLDPEDKGTDPSGLATRLGYVASGVTHAALALAAAQLLVGAGGGGAEDQTTRDWTARLLSQPLGPWLVGGVGLSLIGAGLYQLYEAYTAKFREDLKLSEMSATEQCWATRAGRVGLAARGIVFGLIGAFLIKAAWEAEPGQARGLAGALEALATSPLGPWLLGLVALGLVAYGSYMMIVEARYRRMSV